MTANYQVEIVDGVVVIFDLDTDRNVTNDIRQVLQAVDIEIGGIGNRRVIYRDSTKTFDGIHHRGDEFQGFFPIGEYVLEAAVSKARAYNIVPI